MPSEQELQQVQMQHAVESHQQLLSRGALAHAVGAEVGRMLDYLSKELVRYAAGFCFFFLNAERCIFTTLSDDS